MITYQSRFLTRGEVWFENEPEPLPVDWLVYHQRPEPTPGGSWRPFYTRVVDLTPAPESLLSGMDGFTAADIRKAPTKDGTICRRLQAAEPCVLNAFAGFYDHFAALRNLGAADRSWLHRTAEAGRLDLWAADSRLGERLVYHLFYRDAKRVRSVHSASLYTETSSKDGQRAIGRANRLLVWNCMLHYRDMGITLFDLGGWYSGATNAALLGVNKFKQSFGGTVLREWEGERLLTFKALAVVTVGRFLERLKKRRPSSRIWGRQEVQLEPA